MVVHGWSLARHKVRMGMDGNLQSKAVVGEVAEGLKRPSGIFLEFFQTDSATGPLLVFMQEPNHTESSHWQVPAEDRFNWLKPRFAGSC